MKNDSSRYAWFKTPVGSTPEHSCDVANLGASIVPGMGQWSLIHLARPMKQSDLPAGMLLAITVVALINKASVDDEERIS